MPLPAQLPRCRYTAAEIAEYQAKADAIRDSPKRRRRGWRRGQLWWLLDLNQYRAYCRIRAALGKPYARFVLNWARRTGKTFVLLVIALEECIRNPRGRRYNIAAATKESLNEFIWPSVNAILETCPEELRPVVQEAKGRITFVVQNKGKKRGASYLVLAGCNDSRAVERLRGPFSHGNIVEEGQAIPDTPGLRYVLVSILNPQLKSTGGWTLIASTPPPSPGHEIAAIMLHAEAAGHYDYAHTFDCPRYTEEQHLAYMESDALLLGLSISEYIETADFRREWLALIEIDPTYAVLPTFTPEKQAIIVKKPEELDGSDYFVDAYDAMDIGFSPDWTGLLYAHWSFARQKLRIVGERLMRRMGTPELAEAVKADEVKYHGVPKRQVWKRVADNTNPILLKDLSLQFDLMFSETKKDDLRAAVADVCRWIANGTIEIDAVACKQLVVQMKAATWNKKGTEFTRSITLGHFDLVAALIYLVRNVIPHINRVPPHYGLDPQTHFLRKQRDPEAEVLEDLFEQ